MYGMQAVLALLVLYVGLVHSFSWNIVTARSNKLEFYNEGTLAYTVTPASHRIKWITYDPVHDRVLFSETHNKKDSAFSFDIANQTIQSLIKKKTNQNLKRFTYDPATELLFGTVTKSIYSFPLGPGNNNDVNGDLVITLETVPREVAVDSCGGYIYWRANNIIERALFNGSEREVVIDNTNNVTVQGLTIDSQKIYWIETQEYHDGGFSIESADLDGNNKRTLYSETESDSTPDALTISKDFITWGDNLEPFFWQLPKNPPKDTDVKPNKIAMHTTISFCCSDIAANYKIEERIKRVPNCNALLNLLPEYHVCLNAFVFCVHGTKVIGESRCDCIQGYIGERCDVSVCENYCLQGDCKVNVEGQPTCRCNAGYSGERCDVYACRKHCLNNGVCSLTEEDQPVCKCTGQYEGGRCDVLTTLKAGAREDDDGTPTSMNQTMKTTTVSNTDVENKTTFTITTDKPITPEENIESFTNKNSVETFSHETPYKGFHWLPLDDGKLPPNAIIGGFEDGNATYIARANHIGSLCPGKYVKSTGIAYVPWGMEEHIKKQFEILCGFNAKWVKTDYDNIPKNAFVGGRTGAPTEVENEPLYICRAKIDDSLICGKAHARTKKCYLPYKGAEKEMYSYDILVEE